MKEVACPYCRYSKMVPENKIPAGARWARCPRCKQRFELPVQDGSEGPPMRVAVPTLEGAEVREEKGTDRQEKGSPWERRSTIGLWPGIYRTVKEVLFTPDRLFSRMGFTGGLKEPLAFGLLLGSLGGMVGLFWQFLVFSAGLSPLTEPFFDRFAVGLVFLIILGFIPAVVILAMFLYSGVLHLLLLAVGGGKRGYEATFRVVSYSQAAQAWGLIPFIGGWIGSLWQVIVQIIGLREIHGTSYLRVIIAFLIPLALLLILGITVSIVLLAYLAQQGGNPS